MECEEELWSWWPRVWREGHIATAGLVGWRKDCVHVCACTRVDGGGRCLGCVELLKGATVRLDNLKNVHPHQGRHQESRNRKGGGRTE